MTEKFTLIGIDGGATKVSGWIVRVALEEKNFILSTTHSELNYSSIPGFMSDFKPLPVTVQLQQREQKKIALTAEEIQQGSTYTEACARTIIDLARKGNNKPILVGIGMPGLKTEDRLGISALANGPRIVQYATQIEEKVKTQRINFLAPIAHIGSDADYCGIGEAFARDGSFQKIYSAYYLGGGTGTADALLLRKELVPFDQTKNWLAKTWEMKNDLGVSMEKYASASGLQFIFSQKSGISVEELNLKKIFPPQIAQRALKGEAAAIETYQEAATNLSLLLFERITTLYAGWQSLFGFVNPARTVLTKDHPCREEIFERIIIGQRLGDLIKSEAGKKVLLTPLMKNLSGLIAGSPVLPPRAKEHYLTGKRLKTKILVCSKLREAPALGAGIDAYHIYKNKF